MTRESVLSKFDVGDKAVTVKVVESMCRRFEIGTPVTIIDISFRGYDLMDEYGNKITETGFDSVE